MSDVRTTGRWRGVVALSLFAGAVGLLAQRPSLLLLASVGVGYAVYPRLVPEPPEPDLAVERTISERTPAHGESVDVAVTVRNEGDRWLTDLRVVDGVPALLPVVDGTPRRATALGPGEETTIEYAVEGREGKHRFEPSTVLTRDLGGATERTTTVHESTVIDCGVSVPQAALRDLTRRRTGELVTDDGGSGLEFHRMREYRRGDPVKRIDWRRFASGGDLTTVEFREEQAAAVVLCVDVGTSTAPDEPGASPTAHAVARSVAAADRLAAALADANHEFGLAALGPEPCWLPLGVGKSHLAHLRQLLDADPAFAPSTVAGNQDDALDRVVSPEFESRDVAPEVNDTQVGPTVDQPGTAGAEPALSDGGRLVDGATSGRDRQTAELRERLGGNTQITLLSPLADDDVVGTVRTLEAAGHPVTVVSPDTTAGETVGNRLAARERTTRIQALRRLGVPVVDWQTGDHLGNALAKTMERYR
ncbi:DUF58 domain-containing protein [Halobacteria archaeon HArc-gm2]|nr:DUF58 domain-containing protein [Halobacteria archaeon HArc-gm2]